MKKKRVKSKKTELIDINEEQAELVNNNLKDKEQKLKYRNQFNGEVAINDTNLNLCRDTIEYSSDESIDKSNHVKFAGLTFDMDKDRAHPQDAVDEQLTNNNSDNTKIVNYLHYLQMHGLLSERNDTGLIIYADDQYVNQQSLKINLQDIGMADRLVMMSNGQEVVDFFNKQLEEYENFTPDLNQISSTPPQRVSLLLLDINMPILDGLATLQAVKDKFKQFNLTQSHYHRDDDSHAKQDEVARPMICYLSQ